ncbi:MAG: hypothetical protein LC676_06545 [Loktanella sp.]|nr:hypothetical protein [Loktanella sp.]
MSRVLHAGFHKTGSSFLQNEFFPKLENIVFVRKLHLGHLPILKNEEMSVVISNEAACGYPYPYTQEFSTERLESNINLLAINKVLIIEREFYSWVLSLYYQTLNEKHTWSLEDFISNNRINLMTWRAATKEIEDMCKNKGIDILVLPHHYLVTQQEAALDRISEFVGGSGFDIEDINLEKRNNASRYGQSTIAMYRFMNFALNNMLGHAIERMVKKLPRRLINDRLGIFLDKISPRKLVAEDVRKLMQ